MFFNYTMFAINIFHRYNNEIFEYTYKLLIDGYLKTTAL